MKACGAKRKIRKIRKKGIKTMRNTANDGGDQERGNKISEAEHLLKVDAQHVRTSASKFV